MRRGTALLATALATGALGLSAVASAQEKRREAGAHVHGTAQLNIAVDGPSLQIELEAPAADIVGFEHAPATKAEKATAEKALARLKDGAKLFKPTAAAQCILAKADAEFEAAEGGDHNGHADVAVRYAFECKSIAGLRGIDIGYFAAFPAASKLAISIVTARGQTARTATRAAPRIQFSASD